MKFLYTIWLIALSGCGSPPEGRFDKYIRLYHDITGELYMGEIKVVQYQMEGRPSAIAWCSMGIRAKTIYIRQDYLDRSPEIDIEQTMLHELGHCTSNLMHDDRLDGGCPVSIMNSYKMDEFCYKKNRNKYFNDLVERL
jgi:hypothetical protein